MVKKILVATLAVFTVLVLIFVIFLIRLQMSIKNPPPAEIEYRTDIEPLIKQFPLLEGSTECYWKAATINDSIAPGPTDIYIKGFVVLQKDIFEQFVSQYTWEENTEMSLWEDTTVHDYSELTFEKGIDPKITGYSSFNWHRSDDFNEIFLNSHNFIGETYLDFENGILYIDATTH